MWLATSRTAALDLDVLRADDPLRGRAANDSGYITIWQNVSQALPFS